MTTCFITLAEIHQITDNAALIEIAKIMIVSVGWVGGLAAFVYWKEKHSKKIPV